LTKYAQSPRGKEQEVVGVKVIPAAFCPPSQFLARNTFFARKFEWAIEISWI